MMRGMITDIYLMDYFYILSSEQRVTCSLSETDQALLELMDRVDLTEEEKIKQVKYLVQECGANVNAKENDSVLWKAIETDAPALVSTIIELGADLRRTPRRQGGQGGILSHTVRLYKANTPKIIEALCLGGAEVADGWSEDFLPPYTPIFSYTQYSIEEELSSYYRNIRTLLKYSNNIEGSLLDKPLYIFIKFGIYDKVQSNQAIKIEILKLFIDKGADLFYTKSKDDCTALELVRDVIHERGALDEVCEFLLQVSPIEKRLNVMTRLSDLAKEHASFRGYYFRSLNMLNFANLLDQQVLAIKQIRTVSRLLAQGMSQENSIISMLCVDLLFVIASQSFEIPQIIPARYARQIVHSFFSRPPTSYTDGCSPLPLALRYDKSHTDGNSPWPILRVRKK